MQKTDGRDQHQRQTRKNGSGSDSKEHSSDSVGGGQQNNENEVQGKKIILRGVNGVVKWFNVMNGQFVKQYNSL